MKIVNLIAPSDQNKWHPVWHKCYNIWKSSPYQIKLWSDEEIDEELNNDDPDFFQILQSCPPIYKWDYFRYLLLEKYGGIYFDMDIEIKRDFLSKLSKDIMYLAGGYCASGVEPSILISYKNEYSTRFWATCKLYIQNRVMRTDIYENRWADVLWKTGPWALSFFLNQWISIHTAKRIQILPYELFSGENHDLGFSTHHFTNTWHQSGPNI